MRTTCLRKAPAVLSVLGVLTLLQCASIQESIRERIERQEYADAIERGEEWLVDNGPKDDDRPRVEQVRRLVAEAHLRQAQAGDYVDAYRAYRSRFADRRLYGAFLDEALLSESRAFLRDRLHECNDLARYREFRDRYGAAPDLPRVRGAEVALAYRLASQQDDVNAYASFRRDYEAWPEARAQNATARQREMEIARDVAEHGNTPMALKGFLGRYGTWPEAREAVSRFEEMLIEFEWKDVVRNDTWEAYLGFADRYPASPHFEEAESLGRVRWGFAGPAGPDELRAVITQLDDREPHDVQAYVQVLDEVGDAVGGLPESHFEVFENGNAIAISSFAGMESDRPADIVFVLDTTGSMKDEIGGVKSAAIQFAESLRMRNRDIRLGLVTFGDDVRKVYPRSGGLTSSVDSFRDWVSKQSADGGGDDPENSLGALVAATKLSFRKDAQVVFILITDAPPHQRDRVTPESVATVAQKLLARRVTLFSVSPNLGHFQFLASSLGGRLFELDRRASFSAILMRISTMTAKQYQLGYDSPSAPKTKRTLRVRVHRDNAWIRTYRLESRDVSCLLALAADSNRIVAGTRDAGLWVSPDGGEHWHATTADLDTRSFETLMAGSTGTWVLAVSSAGRLFRSVDAGETWAACPEGPSRVVHIVQDPYVADRLFALDDKQFWATEDGGRTWSPGVDRPADASAETLAFDPVEPETAWLLGATGARASRDRGLTWATSVLTAPSPGVELSACRFFSHRAWRGILYAVTARGELARSTDRGKSWKVLFPGVFQGQPRRAQSLVFDPSSRHWLLLATDLGVLASRDAGASWFQLSQAATPTGDASLLTVGPDGRLLLASRLSGDVSVLNPVADREFISGNVYFAYDSAEIDAKLQSFLRELADHMRKRPDVRLRVEGHTDDIGDEAYNLQLSISRAASIQAYLATRGISANRVLVEGHGKSRPMVPNTSAINRARNRRVELTLVSRIRPLPAYSLAPQ